MSRRIALLICCAAVGIASYALLNFWNQKHEPLFRRFEQDWREDVVLLEKSHKLPAAWGDIHDYECVGGTPESKEWLAQIHKPLHTRPDGHYHLDCLVVAWEEDGKRGAMVQYNLVDLKSGNTVWELGRTFILAQPPKPLTLREQIEELL